MSPPPRYDAATPRLSRSALAMGPSVFARLQPAIDAARARGVPLVPLHIGDTWLDPPPAARFELHAPDADGALYRYGATFGELPLREAVAAMLRREGGELATVDAREQVLVTSGATHAAWVALRSTLDDADRVLVPTPAWPLTQGVVRAAGGVPVEVPFSTRLYDDPSLDPADLLREALVPGVRALYLTTPNNPDGKVLSLGQLASIARFAVERELWVLSDEVYADYAYARSHASIAAIEGMAARTLVVRSLSKSHALAGARVGALAAPSRVVEVARRVSTHSVFNVPVIAQRAALAALEHGDGFVASARRAYVDARDRAARALEGRPLRFALAEGGSYLFVDFAEVLDGRPLDTLLERAIARGVLLAPGDASGAAHATFARLCYTAVAPEALDRGVAALVDAVDALARG